MQELTVTHQDATSQLESSIQRMQQDMELSQQSHLQQMQHVEQQNSELREIVSASMHTKRASTIKLETAMNALNLSRGSAARFIEVFGSNCIRMFLSVYVHTRYGQPHS